MSVNKNFSAALKSHQQGRFSEAEALYRQVLKEQPGYPQAIRNLGFMANQVGKYQIAINLLDRYLKKNPTDAAAYNVIGNAFVKINRPQYAIASYRQALKNNPDFVPALYNLGGVLSNNGRHDEAIRVMNRVLKLQPDSANAYNVLATSYKHKGHYGMAVSAYRKALSLNPGFALAYNNLGNTYLKVGFMEQALECYQAALKFAPNYVVARFNMGSSLWGLRHTKEAIEAFNQALAVRPNWPDAQFSLTRALQAICEWENPHSDINDYKNYFFEKPGKVDPFFFLSQNSTHAEQLLCATNFAKKFAVPEAQQFRHTPKKSKRKIRIGYISGNFHKHPNSYLSVGMFEQHDRNRFEVFGYSYGFDDKTDIRKRVEESFDHFHHMQEMTDIQIAQKIYDDGIDILIDRQGYTLRHRMTIASYRPAPIQVNYLGYPGTMGSEAMDYVIADPFVLPADQQEFYVEKLVHLPDCYQSTDNKQKIAKRTPTRSECGLPEDAFVFCSFNNSNKVQPEFYDVWMRLLKAAPGSVLWLLSKDKLTEDNLRKEAKKRGVDSDRIIFAPSAGHEEHLARQKVADLLLDTLPYNAHTTASDALWAGLPMLTCVGNTFAGRVGGSILQAVGLPELITYSLTDYEALATKLATDKKAYTKIRNKLKRNRLTTPLFDTELYTRNMEEVYIKMYKNWQAGNAPKAILK